MIRIAVTGTHCVGKTTLIRSTQALLQAQGVRCGLLQEPIDKLGAEIRGLDLRGAYMRLIEEHFQRLGQDNLDCCLYDRSLLDMLVYFRCSRDQDPILENMMVELLQWHRQFIDLYVYLPIEIPLIVDQRRPADEALRMRIDDEIKRVLNQGVFPQLILNGSVEQRSTQLYERVKNMLVTDIGTK
jgi:thymidylate kinase